jgi:hypothetical protein
MSPTELVSELSRLPILFSDGPAMMPGELLSDLHGRLQASIVRLQNCPRATNQHVTNGLDHFLLDGLVHTGPRIG